MLLDTSSTKVNLSKVFRLSSSAAFLWKKLATEEDFSEADVVNIICDEYEVDTEVAKHDVKHLLDVWKNNGIIS